MCNIPLNRHAHANKDTHTLIRMMSCGHNLVSGDRLPASNPLPCQETLDASPNMAKPQVTHLQSRHNSSYFASGMEWDNVIHKDPNTLKNQNQCMI